MNHLLELRDVHKTYQGKVPAVRGVTLRVDPLELVSIVGPSGSGKSTLLNLIGTLDRPDGGSIHFKGRDISRLTDGQLSSLRSTQIGFVFQQFHLPRSVPAVDAVADGLLYAGVARRERRARAVSMLRRLGLGDRVHHRPNELSGGEQQRVAVARACIGRPALLLADEPTGNLDTQTGHELMELLVGLREQGTAVIIITHNDELAARTPRRIAVRDGTIREDSRQHPSGV